MQKPFELPWWVAILISVIILGFGILIGSLTEVLSTKTLLTAIGLVILASLVSAVVTKLTSDQMISIAEQNLQKKIKITEELWDQTQKELRYSSNVYQNNILSLEQSLGLLKEILQDFNHSLITYDMLKQIEISARENSEIWILTTTLNLEEQELKDIVYANIKKGICYKYLLPKEDLRIQRRMIDFAQEWKHDCKLSPENAQKQIQCFLVPRHFAYMTVLIYDPFNDPPTVLIKFPANELYDRETYSLIFKVDNKPRVAWSRYVEALQELMLVDQVKPCKAASQLNLFGAKK